MIGFEIKMVPEARLELARLERRGISRPRPWQGRALPTELFPHTLLVRCILREFEILSIEDLKKKFKC